MTAGSDMSGVEKYITYCYYLQKTFDDILAISQCTIEETVAELMTRYILRRLETK